MESWDQKQSQSFTIIVKILLSKVFNTALLSQKQLIQRTQPRAVERFTISFYVGDQS